MTLILVAAVAVVAWAAVISIRASVQPLNTNHAIASTVLTVAVMIQRLSAVQNWINRPAKNSKRSQAEELARSVLTTTCTGQQLSEPLMGIRIHVWEVPRWYRRIFPLGMRERLRASMEKAPVGRIRTWTIRPQLKRVTAVGFIDQAPSRVRFKKGKGIIGVCIASNDPGEYWTINTGERKHKRALESKTEAEWSSHDKSITHGLSLREAKKLSNSYGQVIAHVIQDPESGEAIGCATISIKQTDALQIVTDPVFRRGVLAVATSVARTLA